jgi:hypothetical protein
VKTETLARTGAAPDNIGKIECDVRPPPHDHALTIVTTLAAVAAALNLWGCKPRSTDSAPATEGAAEQKTAYTMLTGRWQRPDGGYVLEIKSVDKGGAMVAAYFHPNPIHVAKAQSSIVSNTLSVFVELRDVNYPGATYKLTYRPQRDQLVGSYHQPLVGLTFEVFFQRLKP